MTILFYRRVPETGPENRCPPWPDIRLWRPGRDGLPGAGPWRASNAAWWGVDRLGLFANHDFTEISLWDGRWLLHRLILTPRWYRFPFMASEDLQIGDVWTEPHARGQGLAGLGVAIALAQAGGDRRVWYVVEADNDPSIRLIERCGFERVGEGLRTKPFGLGILGRFVPRRHR